MPLALLLAAVGTVAVLMAIGWRQRWDPTPQELPWRTLRTAREEVQYEPPPPPWLLAVFVPIAALPLLGYLLSRALDRPWLAQAGLTAALVLVGVMDVVVAKVRRRRRDREMDVRRMEPPDDRPQPPRSG